VPSRWGEAIQRLLLDRGWTQKQLADQASIRPNTLTNIIKHAKDTDTATLTRVAAAMNVDIAELFVTREQGEMLRAVRDNRIERVKESVLSELSTIVGRLVREDYERYLTQPAAVDKDRPRKKRTAQPRKR
jgi:transcriptional regulator with XRE-family HTH domain